jgi:thioesterase domain-containing protein
MMLSAGSVVSPSLVCMTKGSLHRQPIFCVHGADGKISYFGPLAGCLGPDQPFYGLRARGLDDDQPPRDCIEEMAEAYISAIETINPDGPYSLSGYSAGGVIAYEMARQILQSGRQADLIIFDAVEPRDMSTPVSMTERLGLLPKLHPQVLMEWPMLRLRSFLRNRSITPPDVVGEAYWRAQCAYQPEPYAGDLYLIRALRAFTHHLRSGPTLGWQKLVSGTIEVCDIDCTHFELFEKPAVSQVAAAVRKRLDLKHVARRGQCSDFVGPR